MSVSADGAGVTQSALAPAGFLSRVGKLVTGVLQLQLVYSLVTHPGIVRADSPRTGILLVAVVAIAFAGLSWTVNLGFNKKWGARPFIAAVVLLAAAVALTLATTGGLWGVPTALMLYVVTVYVHGHMGLCHVLAAVMATRGCEMRALPQLWARLTRGPVELRACPGIWTPLDNWEHAVRSRRRGGEPVDHDRATP